jgi:hypothetical protein
MPKTMKKLVLWICVILLLVLAVNKNPTKLDFIKHIRDEDINIKFPMVKGENQEYSTILNFRIFTVYKFTKTEHIDYVSADKNQVYIDSYNGRFKEFSGVYLGLFNNFIKVKSKTNIER